MSALPVRSHKMEALGTMAGGIPHRTPVEIQRVVAEALELLKVGLPPYIRLVKALSASDALVIADPTPLHRVIFFKLDFRCRNDRCEVQL